jgi:hypothetical protein
VADIGMGEIRVSLWTLSHPTTRRLTEMPRDTDWHVFDKACEITAMAARGTADQVSPAQLADIFREVFGALRDAAGAIDATAPAGF